MFLLPGNILVSHRLTPQQIRVMQLVALGKANKQIAFEMGLSINTVRSHMCKIRSRLGVHNRTEVAIAFRDSANALD